MTARSTFDLSDSFSDIAILALLFTKYLVRSSKRWLSVRQRVAKKMLSPSFLVAVPNRHSQGLAVYKLNTISLLPHPKIATMAQGPKYRQENKSGRRDSRKISGALVASSTSRKTGYGPMDTAASKAAKAMKLRAEHLCRGRPRGVAPYTTHATLTPRR